MGLISAGDEYYRRTDQALGDLPNIVKLVDDILVFGGHLNDVRQFLLKCRENKISEPKKIRHRRGKVQLGWIHH